MAAGYCYAVVQDKIGKCSTSLNSASAKSDLACSAIDKNGLKVDDGHSSIVFPKIHHIVFLERAMERNHKMEWRDVKIAVIGNSATAIVG
jgi:hypothetical protein